jgi:predicted Zn-dependent protease
MRRRAFLLGCCVALPCFARPDAASEEGGLWAFMDREEQRLKRSPFLIRDRALNDYVKGIACRLAGEHCADLRIYLLRTPVFNATMAPNGMMQIWSGLLLRMSNEAQLAAIIGHEIGHYLARHSLERLRDAKNRSAFGQLLSIALSPAAVLGGAMSSLAQLAIETGAYAYGREHEREADRIGLELMTGAGYAPIEAAHVWSQLLEEVREEKSLLFATHPAAAERRQYLEQAANAFGERGAHAYQAALAPHRTMFLHDEILRRRFDETMVLLERMLRAAPGDGEVQFFKGETYRVRAEPGDFESALAAYRAARHLEGAPPELYRSMGLVLRRLGQANEASRAFRRYLELRPSAVDAELVRSYL